VCLLTRVSQVVTDRPSERVIIVWNELSVSTDFSTITRLKGSILNADFSDYLVCFNCGVFCYTSLCILCVFYCTSLEAAVSALCALLSSHTYQCPCYCLNLFYDNK